MKFAKTLEDVMVPEWRTKYVEYKIGKKRIKTTTNNLRNALPSPAINALRLSILSKTTSLRSRSPNLERPPVPNGDTGNTSSLRYSLQPTSSPRVPIPGHQGRRSSYGSSGYSPGFVQRRNDEHQLPGQATRPPSLVLPDPLQPITPPLFEEDAITLWPALSTVQTEETPAPPVVLSNSPLKSNPPLLKRLFTLSRVPATPCVEHTPTIEEVRAEAGKEFLKWLLGELEKCEDFYQTREEEALKRFDEMHEQLEILRDRWFKAKHNIPFEDDDVEDITDNEASCTSDGIGGSSVDTATHSSSKKRVVWKSFADAMNGLTRPHPTTAQVNAGVIKIPEGTRDYVRRAPARKPLNNPPHRVAKRKLKRAYIGYYHGLEMLKSYVTVNRECFRKITKKFDKASSLKTSSRFMTEYVDKSKFGGADNELDDLLNDTETLFARFFERGNRKEASMRLRPRENKIQFYGSVGRSGVYLGSATIIGILGLYNANLKLDGLEGSPEVVQTIYLLQIWGGISLFLLQALLFTINLRVWSRNKINYAFIFEFDPRHQLNYRQFLELPALLILIFAICFWFSSMDFWNGRMDMINWPVVYISIAAAIIANPFKFHYFRSRWWLLRTTLRLLVSGAYPVEFKDFWMGDMLCSQTYALGNISLFFCLYHHSWKDPAQCDSNHSRLMGFFTAVPAIWRLFQCIRRYYNSGMWFPHLANGAKYALTVSHFTALSIWRLQVTDRPAKAAFILCASLNSIFTTIWDVVMDWSLLDPYAERPFLRKSLGFKSAWPYYLAMFVDPIIRSSWFLYIIYGGQVQHSALQSFLFALAEVLRRFMWCFFRMENEHVGNVGANRAFRVVPLPYHLPSESPSLEEAHTEPIDISTPSADLDLERLDPVRRRAVKRDMPRSPIVRAITRVGRTMNQAHLQDYERRSIREEEPDLSGDSDEEEDFYERTRDTEVRMSRGRNGTIGSRTSGTYH